MKIRNLRRAIMTAALSLTLVASVSACRVEQGAAFFVGDTRVAETEITALADTLPDNLPKSYGSIRNDIIVALVTVEVGKRVAADKGLTPNREQESAQQEWYAMEWQTEKSNPVVQLLAERDTYREILTTGAKLANVSDDDIHNALDTYIKALGQKLKPSTRENFTAWLSSEDGQMSFGRRNQIVDYFDEYDVSANPRFGEISIVIATDSHGLPIITASVPQ